MLCACCGYALSLCYVSMPQEEGKQKLDGVSIRVVRENPSRELSFRVNYRYRSALGFANQGPNRLWRIKRLNERTNGRR